MHRLRRRLFADRGGPWSGGARFFGSGEVRIALLSLLAESPAHGYELMSRLEKKCGGSYRASAGTVYPTLQQLEDEGLVRSDSDGGKKVYSVTAAGTREVSDRAQEIADMWRRTGAMGEWGVFQDPEAGEILGPVLRLAKSAIKAVVKSHGDPQLIDDVRAILDDARTRIERRSKR
jgi:DNA-binding PadR family transcriptional regulator